MNGRRPRGRVLISSRLFLPEPGAAAYRLGALARELASRGVEIDVLTTIPPSGSPPPSDPEGVRVSRWPVLRDEGGNVRGYVQFASFDGPLAGRLLAVRRPGVVVTEPPPTTGTVVRLACAVRRVPYVYYAGDVSSTAAEGIGVSRSVVAVLRRVEAWAMGGAATVLAVSDGVADEVRRLTKGRVRVVVVGTGVDTDVFAPLPDPPAGTATNHGSARPVTEGIIAEAGGAPAPLLVYAGTMSEIHGASVFVEAFATVANAHPTARLVLCGQGSEEAHLRRRARELVGDRISFRGVLPGSEVAELMRSAHAGLASLHPRVGYDYAYPTKMFAATACGTPVVYAGPGPGRALVEQNGLGWASDWDVDQVAHSMDAALCEEPSPGRRQALRTWTVEHASQRAVARRAADAVLAVSASSTSA